MNANQENSILVSPVNKATNWTVKELLVNYAKQNSVEIAVQIFLHVKIVYKDTDLLLKILVQVVKSITVKTAVQTNLNVILV